jgi:hypothetical protein
LVSREAMLTLPVATNVVVIGYAVNNLLPARLGEFARAGMLSERSGLPYAQSLTVTFLERVLDGLVLLLLLLIAASTQPARPWIAVLFPVGAAVFITAAALVLLAVMCPVYVLTLVGRLGRRLPPRIQEILLQLAESVVNGVAYLRRPSDAAKVVALSLTVWLLETTFFCLMLPACGLRLDFRLAMLAMTVTNLAILAPFSPGFIGTFHVFCAQALISIGIAGATAMTYAVIVHLAFFVPITLWGMGILFMYGFTLQRTFALTRGATRDTLRDSSGRELLPVGHGRLLGRSRYAEPEEKPTPFMMALVAATLPLDEYNLRGPEREEAVGRVAAFVVGQIRELPLRLVLMFQTGMIGFRAITWLRHVRPFVALSSEEQKRWVELWAFGRIALTRQLLRAVRATAILAFFELPAVQAFLQPPAAAAIGEPDPSS